MAKLASLGGLARRAKMAVAATILLLLCAPLQAADPDIRAALVAYQVAFTADVWSTERGLDRGHTEANPLSEARPTDSALALKYAAWTATVWLLADKVAAKHPKAARWLLISGTFIHLACAYHNERLE